MAVSICMFNHKGGVSKTTNAYHLGWMLAEKGKRVLLVDADSQCNLSNLVLGEEDFEQFYVDNPTRNIKEALAPAFEAKPALLEAVECVPVKGREDLWLLPGSFELSEYEVSLGVSFTLSDSMLTLKNLPGSFSYLLGKTAERYDIDYILIDMNPSLSAINQALLISSNYFIVPTSPDNFSTMAIRSLAQILPRWEKWASRARTAFADAYYPLPDVIPKFLGTIIQGFNIRKGEPTIANQEVMERLNEAVRTIFTDTMKKAGMILPDEMYPNTDYCLAKIRNFQSLNPAYQRFGIPVYAITDKQLACSGPVLQQYQKTRQEFYDEYSKMTDAVIKLTSYE